MDPKFFASPPHFRKWFEKNHNKKSELLVGYYKKGSGKPSITWPESVDQALCFGWIDGIRQRLDDESYTIRFTPRKEKSHWSAVNLKRFAELKKQKLVHPSGQKAFDRMDKNNSKRASFEQKNVALGKDFESQMKANKKVWAYYQNLAPSYKKASIWSLISAKQEATKQRRLDIFIKCCEAGEKIPMLRPAKKK
ncbi:MAG: YdeI/OmpD-associated family protein [Cyclobacteriaceae bacterium]